MKTNNNAGIKFSNLSDPNIHDATTILKIKLTQERGKESCRDLDPKHEENKFLI